MVQASAAWVRRRQRARPTACNRWPATIVPPPIATTRGDRMFIGLLSAAYLNLAFVAVSEKMIDWFGLEQEPSIWISFVVSMALLALIMKKG